MAAHPRTAHLLAVSGGRPHCHREVRLWNKVTNPTRVKEIADEQQT